MEMHTEYTNQTVKEEREEIVGDFKGWQRKKERILPALCFCATQVRWSGWSVVQNLPSPKLLLTGPQPFIESHSTVWATSVISGHQR